MINVADTPNPETKKFVFEFEISEGSREFLQKDKIYYLFLSSIYPFIIPFYKDFIMKTTITTIMP